MRVLRHNLDELALLDRELFKRGPDNVLRYPAQQRCIEGGGRMGMRWERMCLKSNPHDETRKRRCVEIKARKGETS